MGILALVSVGLLIEFSFLTAQQITSNSFWTVVAVLALIGGTGHSAMKALNLKLGIISERHSNSKLMRATARLLAPIVVLMVIFVAGSTPLFVARVLDGEPYVHSPVTKNDRLLIIMGVGIGFYLGFVLHFQLLRLGGYSKEEANRIHGLKDRDEETDTDTGG